MAARTRCLHRLLHLGVTLLFAVSLFLTANASLSAHPATSLSTLRLGGYGGPGSNPLDNVEGACVGPCFLVDANLTRILPNDKVAPDLATWTISKSHLVYTFTIRPNARFSNGNSVTAQDAAFSLKRFLTVSNGLGLIHGAEAFNAGKTKTLSGVKVLTPRTLQVTITRPAAYFPALLSNTSTVFDPTVVAGKPLGSPNDNFKTNYLNSTCTGNQGAGPFRFVCHDHSSTLQSFYSGHTPKYTLVPNPYYYGRKPHIRLELPGYTAPADYKAYLADKIDTSSVPEVYLNRWKGKSKEYLEFPSSHVIYDTVNVHLAPFDNVHCRLAVAYALDRDLIINRVLGGSERPTYAIVPRGMLGYYAGNDNPHYNPGKARDELAQCPGRTIPVELKVPDWASHNADEVVIRNLADAGFNIKLKVLSSNDWFSILTSGYGGLSKSQTQLVFADWVQDYPDPQDYCSLLLRSGQPSAVGGWRNAAYDRLVDTADATLNRKKRAQLYIQAQHLALSQGAFISISNGIGSALIKPYVHGLVGSEAYFFTLVPKDLDWANVSISKH